jgi:serine/arginine repetitive matrix protein 1
MATRQPFSRGAMSSGGAKRGSVARLRYPPELDRLVVMRGVKVAILKPWIEQRVTALLGGVEDDVLIAMICNFLEMNQVHHSGGGMYVQLLTFLEKNTSLFMTVGDLLAGVCSLNIFCPDALIFSFM